MTKFNNNLNLADANRTIESVLETSIPDTCECGSIFFRDVTVLKTISALVSPTGQEETVPINVFVCDKCGKLAPSMQKNEKVKKLLNIDNILIN